MIRAYLPCVVLAVAACGDAESKAKPAPPSQPAPPAAVDAGRATNSYLLVSAEARAATARLDDGTVPGALPIAMGSMPRTLTIGTARIKIEPDTSLVTYALDGNGKREVLVLDGDIAADKLAVDASEDDAAELARALDAKLLDPVVDVWVLQREGIWARAAALDHARGIREVFAVRVSRDGRIDVVGGMLSEEENLGLSVEDKPLVLPDTSMKCEDPIAGTWVARTHRAGGDWYEFTLQIARTGTKVKGTIHARFWLGGSSDPTPSETCDDGKLAIGRATMTAAGKWQGGRLTFDGKKVQSARLACETAPTDTYAVDHFAGTLRGDGVLVTTNNDGSAAFDRPYLFRRVACL